MQTLQLQRYQVRVGGVRKRQAFEHEVGGTQSGPTNPSDGVLLKQQNPHMIIYPLLILDLYNNT